MKKAIVLEAGEFIGGHLVKRLKSDGYYVHGLDLRHNQFVKSVADEFIFGDLRNHQLVEQVIDEPFSENYQLASEMGGAGHIFNGDNDADVMLNKTLYFLSL